MAKGQKEQGNELEQIEAFFTTENEHRNKFFLNLYKEAESEQIFENPLITLQNIDYTCFYLAVHLKTTFKMILCY